MKPMIEQTEACRESILNAADRAPAGGNLRLRLLTTDHGFFLAAALLVLMHAGFMLYHYGQVPVAPFVGDEVVIHDPAISLARGHGYIARSFAGSRLGVDQVFAHFPPLYPLLTAAVFRIFGVSVYSLRLTTTVMSIASTAVLAALLLYICRAGLLSRQAAMLVLAIDCSTGSLISLERVARMESMLSLLLLLATFSLFVALLRRAKGPFLWPVVGTIAAGAMSLAVHPEAISAVVLLAGIGLVAIDGHLRAKLLALASALLLPILLLGTFFGRQSLIAGRQFLWIFLHRIPETTFRQWVLHIFHPTNLARSRDAFFLLEIVVLLTAPIVYYVASKGWIQPDTLRRRLLVGTCFAAFLEWMLLLFFLHAGIQRYQFLFGPLMLLNAVCLRGVAPLRRWQSAAAWVFVALNIAVTLVYVALPHYSFADRNPERFQAVLKRIPAEAHLAASSSLWLDLEEDSRQFSCLYPGLDGEETWRRASKNPLQQFDAVVLSSQDWGGHPWQNEAAQDRRKYTFAIGSQSVEVYLREGTKLLP